MRLNAVIKSLFYLKSLMTQPFAENTFGNTFVKHPPPKKKYISLLPQIQRGPDSATPTRNAVKFLENLTCYKTCFKIDVKIYLIFSAFSTKIFAVQTSLRAEHCLTGSLRTTFSTKRIPPRSSNHFNCHSPFGGNWCDNFKNCSILFRKQCQWC